MALKRLPIGQSSFENIIKNDQLYVDKTERIYQLITSTEFNFLARPRRFGKSLLVSTLKNIFLGKKELFKGLWIYDLDWEWKKYPVIIIDFNEIVLENSEFLKKGLSRIFQVIANKNDLRLEENHYKYQFEELIVKLNEKYREQVVVLVDEYDKPIISHLGAGEKHLQIAKENREILKSLFGTLKGENVISRLRFVFLTGVSKFSKAGVFSDLNNLNDITMDARYADLLGITEEEVKTYLEEYLKEIADGFGQEVEGLLARIKDYYNGYRFSKKDIRVYNPFSLINFLDKGDFRNYWFESGTPTFLVKLIKERNFYIPEAEGLEVEEDIFTTYDLESLNISSLLFQTGYLTIKDYDFERNIYLLSYPNREVKYSFLKILFQYYTNGNEDNEYLKLGDYLRQRDLESFIGIAKSIFSKIPFTVGPRLTEATFHTLFYLMVNAGGTPADIELLTSRGRIDMVVELRNRVYIMEFKCNQSAEKAIEQIKEKGYYEPYLGKGKEIILIGINFDTASRNIKEWKWERVG